MRVGPLRRVSRRLLAQSLHASESRASAGAAAELREMLKEAGSPAEAAAIRAELAAAEKGACVQPGGLGWAGMCGWGRRRAGCGIVGDDGACQTVACGCCASGRGPSPPAHSLLRVCAGADRQRKRLLKTVPVVGVTCCSAMLAALDGQRFDVLLLDESSQMVEPLSAIPLLRAQAR